MKKIANILFVCVIFLLSNCDEDEVTSFKMYSSLISQEGTNIPTEQNLKNNLDLTITWTRESPGKFKGVLSKQIDLDNTTIILHANENHIVLIGGFTADNIIEFNSADRFNPYDSFDGLSRATLEIKVFN